MDRVNPSGPHCRYRLFEWTMALALIGLGSLLMLIPDSLSASRFAPVEFMFSYKMLTAVCLFVGILRALVLYANGHLGRYGAMARAAASLVAAAIWSQLAVSLITNGGTPSPSIPVYLALTFGELRSIWRAARDQSNGLTFS